MNNIKELCNNSNNNYKLNKMNFKIFNKKINNYNNLSVNKKTNLNNFLIVYNPLINNFKKSPKKMIFQNKKYKN